MTRNMINFIYQPIIKNVSTFNVDTVFFFLINKQKIKTGNCIKIFAENKIYYRVEFLLFETI